VKTSNHTAQEEWHSTKIFYISALLIAKLDSIWNGIVRVAEINSIHVVMCNAPFLSIRITSFHTRNLCMHFRRKLIQVTVHRNMKTILPYFKVTLPVSCAGKKE
jgi:hypothetical protein